MFGSIWSSFFQKTMFSRSLPTAKPSVFLYSFTWDQIGQLSIWLCHETQSHSSKTCPTNTGMLSSIRALQIASWLTALPVQPLDRLIVSIRVGPPTSHWLPAQLQKTWGKEMALCFGGGLQCWLSHCVLSPGLGPSITDHDDHWLGMSQQRSTDTGMAISTLDVLVMTSS